MLGRYLNDITVTKSDGSEGGQGMDNLVCHFCGEPITKLNGCNSESLCTHHVSYVPEIKVPSHRGCHTKFHNSGERIKREYDEYNPMSREDIIKSFGDEVICGFCGELIAEMNGVQSESLSIHHINGDHFDNRLENLMPTHRRCHMKYHNTGDRSPSKRPEARAKFRMIRLGKPSLFKGKHHNEVGKQKIREATLGEKNPNYGGKSAEKAWDTRRKRYGPSGGNIGSPEAACLVWKKRRELYGPSGRKPGTKGNNNEKAWIKRRRLYGPSGGNEKAIKKRRERDPDHDWAKKAWDTRRKLYGPSGRKKV